MAAQPRAILFDALGTLLSFEPPAPHLRAALLRARRASTSASEAAEARDPGRDRVLPRASGRGPRPGVARRSARALRGGDGAALPGIDDAVLLDALLDSLRFFAYPRRAPALRALRDARDPHASSSPTGTGRCTSGWPRPGSRRSIDGALASAEVGSAKPDGAIFRAALELAGRAPEEAWHVGDTPEADVEGARAAGLRPILIARDGSDRARRRHRDPIAGRTHTLGDSVMTSPRPRRTRREPPRADRPRLGAVRAPLARDPAGGQHARRRRSSASPSATDPSIEADDLPDGADARR